MKRIKGFPDYLIAKDGRVFSLKSKKFLKKQLGSDGYYHYQLHRGDGTRRRYKLHRLFMEYYVDNPKNLPCINHIDGNKKNNSPKNLEWCDYSHNLKHAFDSGLRSNDSQRGSKSAVSKLTAEQVDEILVLLNDSDMKQKHIAKAFGVSESTISRIKRGERHV